MFENRKKKTGSMLKKRLYFPKGSISEGIIRKKKY